MTDKRTRKHGFTIIEMLMALGILAMLLAAVAVAMHASMTSYRENEDLAAITQTARSTLYRMSREIRTAEAINISSTSLTIIPPNDGSGTTEYHYEFADGELTYRVTQSGTPTTYTLIASTDDVQVTGLTVTRQMGLDWEGLDCTKSVTVQLSLSVEGKPFNVTTSASPRRNQTY